MSETRSKYDIRFDEMTKTIKEKEIDLEKLPEGSKKTIIIGIQEALYNEKLMNAARALYTNYQLVRAFVPIIFKLYMKA
jgi:hypothetical protein|tara:strand:+ start:133 stop:369 length:237 start_codon:yes stop_codon:yes gene_type:complete